MIDSNSNCYSGLSYLINYYIWRSLNYFLEESAWFTIYTLICDWKFSLRVSTHGLTFIVFVSTLSPLFFHYPVRSKENGSFICWIVNVEHLSLRIHLKSNVDTLQRLTHSHRIAVTRNTFVPTVCLILRDF